jgi:TPR repeat protein
MTEIRGHCQQGKALWSCDRLGGFFAMGAKGFVKDERRAADLLERACSLGGYACEDARRLRERLGVEDLR